MRFDSIIFRLVFAERGFVADCENPKLALHLPRKTNWKRMRTKSLKRN